MKKSCLCILGVCLLIGCTPTNKTPDQPIQDPIPDTEIEETYARDITPGRVIVSSIDDIVQKMKDKKTFTVVFTLNSCIACERFENVFDGYKGIHNVTLFKVNLDEQSGDAETNKEQILKYFKDFGKTPALYYVQDGEVKGSYDNKDISEETLEAFVTQYEIDKKAQ